MIPERSANGELPPGVHPATWREIADRLSFNPWRRRAAQKQRFLGELFPAQLPEGATGRAFLDFFQVNRLSGGPKGILVIRLGRRSQAK
jgi:hypothetical protein